MVVTRCSGTCPVRDASLLYISHTWLVDGMILGKPARGFLFWEEAWMYPGRPALSWRRIRCTMPNT